MPIRVLAPEVASKIAAGEVVERPASVVKELVENAVDAGATDIKVEVRGGGRRLIRVIDNGCGIPSSEVELAFARHATSKIETADDLARIVTLGFRGEALASIAAVARVTMVTRTAQERVGTLLRLEGGLIVRREGKGCPQGTVVTVENLFYNVPARLKFLRTPATEAAHIHNVVTHYALAFPHLRFTLIADGRLTFQSTGSGDPYDVLIKIYGLEVARQMLGLEARESSSPVNLTGFISPPFLHRSNRSHLTFFVNRRWIQDSMLSRAVMEAYHTLLPSGRYPIVVLYLQLDPSLVDVNVHPTKREVRFRHGQEVFTAVREAVRRSLATTPIPSLALRPSDWERRRRFLTEVGRRRKSRLALEVQRPPEAPVAPRPVPKEQAPSFKLPVLRVLGQLAQTYIIAEGPDGMYLIDQHSAHERILYEKLLAARASMAVASQQLLNPLTLELTPRQREAMATYGDALAELGFQLEAFGQGTYLVRAVPALLKEGDIAQVIGELLDELAEGKQPHLEGDLVVATLACHSAIKAGKTLSMQEMEELVRQLEELEIPRTCPHGRPILLHLSTAQLEREFGRR